MIFLKKYAVNLMTLLQAVQQFVQVYVMNIHKTSVCSRMCVCLICLKLPHLMS